MKIERLMTSDYVKDGWIAYKLQISNNNYLYRPTYHDKDCIFVFDIYNCIGKTEPIVGYQRQRPLLQLFKKLEKLRIEL